MTTGMYGRTSTRPIYSEKELFLNERFLPGELGAIILLEIGALLLFSLAMAGMWGDLSPTLNAGIPDNAQSAPANSAY